MSDMNSPLRTGLRKCLRRAPGEGVTLTDEEVVALLQDAWEAGVEVGLRTFEVDYSVGEP